MVFCSSLALSHKNTTKTITSHNTIVISDRNNWLLCITWVSFATWSTNSHWQESRSTSEMPQTPNLSYKLFKRHPFSTFHQQARLAIYLKTLYIDLSLKEPILPTWVQPVAPGALCPARLEPELRLSSSSHGLNECISVDQILTAIHVSNFILHFNSFDKKYFRCSFNRPKKEHFWKHRDEYLLNVHRGCRKVH